MRNEVLVMKYRNLTIPLWTTINDSVAERVTGGFIIVNFGPDPFTAPFLGKGQKYHKTNPENPGLGGTLLPIGPPESNRHVYLPDNMEKDD
jgi:hypothetical protein